MTTRSQKRTLAIVVALLGFCLGWFLKPCPTATFGTPTVIRDSVLIVVPQPPTVAEIKPKVQVRYRQTARIVDTVIAKEADTLFISPAFTATDSNRVLESGDTLRKVAFQYPENLFSYDFRPRPDSLKIIEKIIIQPMTVTSPSRPLWLDILTHGAVFVAGGYVSQKVLQ